jgi:hypothetical protein
MPPLIGESGYMRHEREFYQTPSWVTLALFKHWIPVCPSTVWEPAAGAGKMVEALMDMGFPVFATDIEPQTTACDYVDIGRHNFLTEPTPREVMEHGVSIITNPPFSLADEFIIRALELVEVWNGSVALLLPSDWDHAPGRGKAKVRARLTEHPMHAMQIKLRKRIRWIEGTKVHPRSWHSWHVWDTRHVGPQQVFYAS